MEVIPVSEAARPVTTRLHVCTSVHVRTWTPGGMWCCYFSYLVISFKMGEGWQECVFSFVVTQNCQHRRAAKRLRIQFTQTGKVIFWGYTFALCHLCINRSLGSKLSGSQLQLGRMYQSLMRKSYWRVLRDTEKILREYVWCLCKGIRELLKDCVF